MNRQKLLLGIILFGLGFTGVLSTLSMDIPLPEEAAEVLLAEFTPAQVKLLTLINPTVLLAGAVLLGVSFHERVSLDVPIIKGMISKGGSHGVFSILKYGITGGVLSGLLLVLTGAFFYPKLPLEFIELGNALKPTLAARFLYGGLTEEIMMRFGLMTFVVWLLSKVFRTVNSKIYWAGITAAALVFAIGHFPVAFQAVGNPSGMLLSYVLIGNAIGGLVFGWLYWKKGLEAAFVAHLFAHVVMLLGEPLMSVA